jgi:hypothetical protein
MHFPDSILPPLSPVTDPTEVTPKAPVSPVRRVVPGFPEALAEQGVPTRQHHEAGAETAAEPPHQEAAPYTGEDRRKMCRRIYHIPVMLDTRSGEERRKHDRPGELPSTHTDEVA